MVVVTYPEPLRLEARPLTAVETPPGSVALGYYHDDRVLARSVVAEEAVAAIGRLLRRPVTLALLAREDETGNIEARVCVLTDMHAQDPDQAEDEGSEEPWQASVPAAPDLGEPWSVDGPARPPGGDGPTLALLPIGNVVRGARDRHHPDVKGDAQEMLANLVAGRGRDAVQKAIDDLLDSL